MLKDFQAGDVVQLKSGGPAMTVDSIYKITAGTQVSVVWFNTRFEKFSAVFMMTSLKQAA